jgi:hypothetical protein
MSMLQRGELVPHFAVARLDGSLASYDDIWQRKNLLFVLLPDEESGERAEYVSQIGDRSQEITGHETECVITTDGVLDLPRPAVVIADRWGEIYFVGNGPRFTDLPTIDEILEWLRFVEHECPECQGETR